MLSEWNFLGKSHMYMLLLYWNLQLLFPASSIANAFIILVQRSADQPQVISGARTPDLMLLDAIKD
jgi:hypothetical protein